MLDRLVGRAVFADVHAVVGEHVDHRLAHERGEAHGRAQVVVEDQEGGAERAEAAVEREAAIQRAAREMSDENKQLRETVQALREQVDALKNIPASSDKSNKGGKGRKGGNPA